MPVPRASGGFPQRTEGGADEVRVVEQADVPGLLGAVERIASGETRCPRIAEVCPQALAPVAAGAVGERYAGGQPYPGQCRCGDDPRHRRLRVRDKIQRQGLEVHQQRIGRYVVRAQIVAVERSARCDVRLEGRFVQYEVAVNLPQPEAAQAVNKYPEPLDHEARVAAAAQNQVAVQTAAVRARRGIHLGAPLKRGAEQIQRRVGREQLHRRGRIHRPRLVRRELDRSPIQRGDHDPDGAGRDAHVA